MEIKLDLTTKTLKYFCFLTLQIKFKLRKLLLTEVSTNCFLRLFTMNSNKTLWSRAVSVERCFGLIEARCKWIDWLSLRLSSLTVGSALSTNESTSRCLPTNCFFEYCCCCCCCCWMREEICSESIDVLDLLRVSAVVGS